MNTQFVAGTLIVGVVVFLTIFLRESLRREINRWPNRPDTNNWFCLIRNLLLVVVLIMALAAARYVAGGEIDRSANRPAPGNPKTETPKY